MKKIALNRKCLLLLAMSFSAYGNKPIATYSLDLGACTIEQFAERWVIHSVNDDQTIEVSQSSLKQFNASLQNVLKKEFKTFQPSTYGVSVHCSSGGHQIAINFFESTPKLCLWAKGSGESYEVHTLSSSPIATEHHPSQFCFGSVPGELLIETGDNDSALKLFSLVTSKYSNLIVGGNIYFSTVHLNLITNYRFFEPQVKDALAQDPEIQALLLDQDIKSIGFNPILTWLGESMPLMTYKYEGH